MSTAAPSATPWRLPPFVRASAVLHLAALAAVVVAPSVWPWALAAVVLNHAAITAIGLTLRERKDTKKVDPSRQVRVRARDRIEVVKLAPTQAPAPVVEAPAAAEENPK